MQSIRIVSFYRFHPIAEADISEVENGFVSVAAQNNVQGLIILGTEGFNATISGPDAGVDAFIAHLHSRFGLERLELKESRAENHPFKKFQVKVRSEIVTLGQPGVVPDPNRKDFHLSPEEWHRVLQEEDVVVLDTRNWYETEIGKFKNAIDPQIEEFSEFPKFLDQSGISKDKKVLIYCTGGIRCEKAILEMHKQGFENTYQLDGGILAYLEKFPNQKFEGECFVFDHRIAVDQNLQPSGKYEMCPHCGQPSASAIQCLRCDADTYVCAKCIEKAPEFSTCSKNCAYHYKLAPGKKGLRQFRDSSQPPAKFRV